MEFDKFPPAYLNEIPAVDMVCRDDIDKMGDLTLKIVHSDSRRTPLNIPPPLETYDETRLRLKRELKVVRWVRRQQLRQDGGLDRT
jgi:hypothetical protein